MQKLYIGEYANVNEKYTYFSPESGYMLVLAETAPNGFCEVPDDKISRLTADEKKWLITSKMSANVDYMCENAKDIVEIMQSFCDNFDIELQNEKAVQDANKGNTDGAN